MSFELCAENRRNKLEQVCNYNDGHLATGGHLYFALIFSRLEKIKNRPHAETQRRGERKERLLMGKFYRLFLALRSLRLERAKRTGVNKVVCFSRSTFSDALLEQNR
jgi:hypothetical protein